MDTRRKRGELRRLVLTLLHEREHHGYSLLREFRRRGWGSPSPGSIYPLLAQLHARGLLQAKQQDGRRVYTLRPSARFVQADSQPVIVSRDRRLETSATRLFQAVAQAEESGADISERVRAILDAARRNIYVLLAEE